MAWALYKCLVASLIAATHYFLLRVSVAMLTNKIWHVRQLANNFVLKVSMYVHTQTLDQLYSMYGQVH